MEQERNSDTIGNWRAQYKHQRAQGEEELEIRTSGDHPHDSIVKIGKNIKMSPGDLGNLLSLELQWKTTG